MRGDFFDKAYSVFSLLKLEISRMNLHRNMANIDFSKLEPVPISSGGFLKWAHHPHCDRHHNHLIWFLGHPYCLGCICMYSGMIVGLPLAFVVEWSIVPFVIWLAFHHILLIPTMIQPWFQKKWFKISSRLVLGINITSFLLTGCLYVSPSFSVWIFRLGIVMYFILMRRLLRVIRNRNTYDPCSDCPLGTFPSCEWNLPRLLHANQNVEVLANIRDSLGMSENNLKALGK